MANLLSTKAPVPKGKIRGLRRRIEALHLEASRFRLNPSDASWWNMWEQHLDSDGLGNRGWKLRREHVLTGLSMVRGAAETMRALHKSFQAFLLLDVDDTSNDVLVIHTMVEGGHPFPYVPEDTEWGSQCTGFVEERITDGTIRVGFMEWSDGRQDSRRTLVVYVPGVGVPLEPPPPLPDTR